MWTSTDLFRVSVLCLAASSSRYRGANPSSSRDRGASSGFDFLLVSAIVVQTVGLADWVSLPNPHSCRYRGTNPGFDVLLELLSWCQPLLESLSWCQPLLESLSWCQPLLESLSWFKPGERLSVANGCVCFSPYCKNTGFSVGSRTGGKVTCRNSKTARNRGFVVVFARSEPVNPVPYCV